MRKPKFNSSRQGTWYILLPLCRDRVMDVIRTNKLQLLGLLSQSTCQVLPVHCHIRPNVNSKTRRRN